MSILYFFADLFGYVLNFLYQLIGNYGVAIIIFSIFAAIGIGVLIYLGITNTFIN